MTDKPTPTTDLHDTLQMAEHETLTEALALLAKWSQPAQAAEPVAFLVCTEEGDPDMVFLNRHEAQQYLEDHEQPIPLYRTPQPAQPQAGAVPLTCEWTHNDDDSSWDTECGQSWRFDDGGPKENHMNFCHCCGKTLRIKGGQHGTE